MLHDALERLSELNHERQRLDNEMERWQAIAAESKALVETYQRRLVQSPALPPAKPTQESKPARKGSSERFGALVMPIADQLIAARNGPVSVEDIYTALPAELRANLDAGSNVYSTPFRLRRMFRRHPKYVVSEAGISLAGMTPAFPEDVTIDHIVRRSDGSTDHFVLRDKNGNAYNIKPAQIRGALRAKHTIRLPEIEGRTSILRLAGGRFYAEFDGDENGDFAKIPQTWEADLTD